MELLLSLLSPSFQVLSGSYRRPLGFAGCVRSGRAQMPSGSQADAAAHHCMGEEPPRFLRTQPMERTCVFHSSPSKFLFPAPFSIVFSRTSNTLGSVKKDLFFSDKLHPCSSGDIPLITVCMNCKAVHTMTQLPVRVPQTARPNVNPLSFLILSH